MDPMLMDGGGMDPMAGGMAPPMDPMAAQQPAGGDPISHLLMALQILLGTGGGMPMAPAGPPADPMAGGMGGPMPPY